MWILYGYQRITLNPKRPAFRLKMINLKICAKCQDQNVVEYDTEFLGEYEGRFYRCRSCSARYLEVCKIVHTVDLSKKMEIKA